MQRRLGEGDGLRGVGGRAEPGKSGERQQRGCSK